jgi:hypothetical protein
LCERQGIDLTRSLVRFFGLPPAWMEAEPFASVDGVAAFLRQLRGKTPLGTLATTTGVNRFTLSRWLAGTAQPKLPQFLSVIDSACRRALDFVAALIDPRRLASVADRWQVLERAREAAYAEPWSHAVLRALELEDYPGGPEGDSWVAEKLGIGVSAVRRALSVLEATEQIRHERRRWRPVQVATVNTAQDPERARALRDAWARIAVTRQQGRSPGHFGYSVFAISKADLRRLRDLHVAYLRAMQDIIFNSASNECVALYCTQLLDLDPRTGNALS